MSLRNLILALILVLSPCLAWGGAANGYFYSPGGPLFTPAKAPMSDGFYWDGASAGNQTFTDAQVLDSTAEGMKSGYKDTLKVIDVSTGSVGVSSNALTMTQGATAWDTLGLVLSETKTRTGGMGLFSTHTRTTAWHMMGFAPESALPAYGTESAHVDFSSSGLCIGYSGNRCDSHLPLTTSSTYQSLLVLGNWAVTVGGGPAYNDTNPDPEVYKIGHTLFMKGGSEFPTWELVFTQTVQNSSQTPIAPYIAQRSGTDAPDNVKYDPKIPMNLMVPKYQDKFNDTPGTALTSHTMDSGGSWTQRYCDTNDDDVNDSYIGAARIDNAASGSAECNSAATSCTHNNGLNYTHTTVEADGLIRFWISCGMAGGHLGYHFRGSAETANGANMLYQREHWTGAYSTWGLYKLADGAETQIGFGALANCGGAAVVRMKGSQIWYDTNASSNGYLVRVTDSFNSTATWAGTYMETCQGSPYDHNYYEFEFYSLTHSGTGETYESILTGIYP